MKISKLMTLLVTGALLVSAMGIGSAQATYDEDSAFDDVESSHENYEAIDYLKGEGVVEGYEDGDYKPEDYINRAEFLKIVMETQGYDVSGYGLCFYDVTDEWFASYVCAAKDMGLISGYEDGYYRPDQYINFAEATKITVNAFLLNVDESNDENWYQQYVVALELLSAIPNSIDSFDKYVTRGEMAEMVWRIDTENTEEESLTYDEVKESDENKVRNITVTDEGDGVVSWEADGVPENGVKVVWSMDEGPEYPNRDGDSYIYVTDNDKTSTTLYPFDGEGSYYVRVCEYLGGECGLYSNQITVYLDSESDDEKEDVEVEEESGDVELITLTDDGGGMVSWVVEGELSEGVKVVWSMEEEPTYPTGDNDMYQYFSSASTTSAEVWGFMGAGTYYVRVCEYLGGECGVYSNEITVELEAEEEEEVEDESEDVGITLSDEGDGTVSWVVDGELSMGVKVVWSMEEEPTYPTGENDQYLYYSDSEVTSAELDAFDGAGTYYVRVCEYLGGACGEYSNEITVEL